MNQTTIISTVLFFVIIYLFGYWLQHTGKPYKSTTFNVHMLVSVIALLYLGVVIYQVNKSSPLDAWGWVLSGLTLLFYLATIISGGFTSLDKSPKFLQVSHKVLPYFTLLSTIAALYLVLTRLP
jgi:hypothetical protein